MRVSHPGSHGKISSSRDSPWKGGSQNPRIGVSEKARGTQNGRSSRELGNRGKRRHDAAGPRQPTTCRQAQEGLEDAKTEKTWAPRAIRSRTRLKTTGSFSAR